jgi:hypothetical protein
MPTTAVVAPPIIHHRSTLRWRAGDGSLPPGVVSLVIALLLLCVTAVYDRLVAVARPALARRSYAWRWLAAPHQAPKLLATEMRRRWRPTSTPMSPRPTHRQAKHPTGWKHLPTEEPTPRRPHRNTRQLHFTTVRPTGEPDGSQQRNKGRRTQSGKSLGSNWMKRAWIDVDLSRKPSLPWRATRL